MHESSYLNMQKFVETRLDPNKEMLIVDIGSQNVGGYVPPYRNLFSKPKWKYIGCDMAEGNNVDIVLKNPYRWKELKSCSADVVVSGQAFEHVEFFWFTMMEIMRILKPGGFCCIIAPSSGYPHRYPVDCWRFYEDGMKAMARFAMLDVLDVYTQRNRFDFEKYDIIWNDSVLIASKPARQGLLKKLKNFIRCRAGYYLMRNIPQSKIVDQSTVVAQVFFDHGKGYYAANSLTSVINLNDDDYTAAFDLNIYHNKNTLYGIRFDPMDFPAKFILKEAITVLKDGRRQPMKLVLSNENKKDGEAFVFNHSDANMYFYPEGTVDEMDSLLFTGKLSAV
jgi:SAM-dependent methyltransferase